MSPDGKLAIIDGKAYSGAVQAQINRILDHGLQVLDNTGNVSEAYSVIQPYLSAIGGASDDVLTGGKEIDLDAIGDLGALITPEAE